MTQDELEEAIRLRWKTGWEALHPADENDPDHVWYTYDNLRGDGREVWVHVSIEPTVRGRTTQGRSFGKYEARGIIRVRLFGSSGVGASQLAGFVDEIVGTPETEGVLDEANIAGLIYREGSARPGPSDGRWEMRVVTVPYSLTVQNQR